jgi:preflagellin peptidase FlaK
VVVELVPFLDLMRFVTMVAILGVASVTDMRTRTVHDGLWVAMLGVGSGLLGVQIMLDGPGPLYLLALLPPIAFMVPALVGIPEPSEAAKGNPEDMGWLSLIVSGVIAYIGSFLFFDWGGEFRWSLALVTVPTLILILYALYAARLIHGGADAKAIMSLALLFPYYPDLSWTGIPNPMGGTLTLVLMKMAFPFAISALFNAALAFIFVPLVFLAINAARGEVSGARSLFGYKMDVKYLRRPGKFVWLLETPERVLPGPEKKRVPARRSVMALHDVEPGSQVRWFRRAGIERAWVTPKIPFIVPLFIGTVLCALVGNVIFFLFYWAMGG